MFCSTRIHNIQKPAKSLDCLLGVVVQPTDRRLKTHRMLLKHFHRSCCPFSWEHVPSLQETAGCAGDDLVAATLNMSKALVVLQQSQHTLTKTQLFTVTFSTNIAGKIGNCSTLSMEGGNYLRNLSSKSLSSLVRREQFR